MLSVQTIIKTGDCVEVMSKLDSNQFELTFADPPFNIGQLYANHHDLMPRASFTSHIRDMVREAWRVTKGVLCLHGPDDLVEQYLIQGVALGMKRIAWVNWCYSFGQYSDNNWTDSRCHCLIYAKPGYKWRPDSVRVPSVRMLIGDSRTANSGGRVPGTVWGLKQGEQDVPIEPLQNEKNWGRVQGNNEERVHSRPNQLPEVYIARLVKAYTDKGDSVLDPYCGTGTTAVVANALGRNCVTIDKDSAAIRDAQERLKKGSVRL